MTICEIRVDILSLRNEGIYFRISNSALRVLALDDPQHFLTGECSSYDDVELARVPQPIINSLIVVNQRCGIDLCLNGSDRLLEGYPRKFALHGVICLVTSNDKVERRGDAVPDSICACSSSPTE